MEAVINGQLQYSIFDPTGNITALVESPVEQARQPFVAQKVMEAHPEVEQVGFVRFLKESEEAPVHAELRMAGGEFCGNASMCAAALFLIRKGAELSAGEEAFTVRLHVSGTGAPVEVRLKKEDPYSFEAGILMPGSFHIESKHMAFGGSSAELPVVRMDGITHIIVQPSSVFFKLQQDKNAAESAVRKWCGELKAAGLGLMFLDRLGKDCLLDPLVYVPGSETVFWENSCASGSAAAGAYLAFKNGISDRFAMKAPGGTLNVTCGEDRGSVILFGKTRLLGEYPEKKE